MGFLDRVRSGCEQSASFKSVNMAVDMKNKYGGSIRSHDCYLKWCIKNSSTQYSFYVMESGVSETAFVIFIGLPPLKMRSTEKETPWERLPEGERFESLRMLRYRSWRSSIPSRNALRQRR